MNPTKMGFAAKIALLPMLAAVAFVVILAISWVTGARSMALLENIDKGYYASLEMSRALEEHLERIRRSFEDAAAMADKDYLQQARGRETLFQTALQGGKSNPIVDVTPLMEIETRFNEYYRNAEAATTHLIDGTGGEEIYDELQIIATQYDQLKELLQAVQSRDKSDVSIAFADAHASQRRGTAVLIVVVVLWLVLLTGVSTYIIRMASRSIRTTVRGIRALAAGDLSTSVRKHTNDEMGVMIESVGQVTGTVNDLANEVQRRIDAVRAGDLRTRGDADRFDGAYAKLVGNVNELIDAFVAPIEVTASYVERISHGDIPPPIRDEYQGDFSKTKNNLNVLVQAMTGLVDQTAALTTAAKAGDLDRRADPKRFAGVWRDLITGINETLDAVTEPMRDVSEVMSALANGDLTRTIDSNYQGDFAKLQGDINSTISRLTDVISSIKGAGDAVSEASKAIADGNESLRQRTEDQASSLRNTSANMQAMIGRVRENADNAHRANETVMAASDKATKGGVVVGDAVRAMDAINASSSKIADIINVIDEIAFQTNLLALNAAVEAARAGEEGRGFAVVASEVRNLAGRSAMAAREINDLIKDSVGKIDEGSRLVHESGQTLEEIVSAVMDVTEIVSQIALSSQDQAASIEGVNEAVAAMDAMTKKNAALADEAVRSSDVMGDEAARLNRTTSFFTVRSEHPAQAKKPGGAALPLVSGNSRALPS